VAPAEAPRVALITGASSGVGSAIAVALTRRGVHVVAVARRADRLEAVAAQCAAFSGEFASFTGDVARADDLRAAAALAVERFGRLDFLVANAGVGHRGALVDADAADLETLMRTNMDGVLHAVRAAVPVMTAGGRVLIVSSIVAGMITPYAALYAASKAFVSSLAAALDYELAPRGIRVTDLRLGRVQTEFNEKRLGEGSRRASRVPEMTPEFVGERCADLLLGRFRQRAALRWFDRLVMLGGLLIPHVIARLATRQYR
jgi:short-subunit dehydrogenase